MSSEAVPSPVALITAGSAGLGAAAARLFAARGYRVVINYQHNGSRASQLADELRASTPTTSIETIQADLGSRADVERLVAEAVARLGRLDVVFSNGGWTRVRGLDSVDDNCHEDEWDAAFNINVKSHLWLLRAAREHLDRARGAFVTTASVAGVSVSGSSLAYAVTKAAQIHLVKALAVMAAPNIRVNSVSPGLLLTEWAERFTPEQKEAHRQKTTLKRIVTVEDVAEQVFTFAQNKSTTGVNIVMDAGFTL
ncbi:short chain dehydrogenase [Biscogniauxia sp. FL1348]|nr:short chain dehydrogenase [Biscogniauxia sp. FL1348]